MSKGGTKENDQRTNAMSQNDADRGTMSLDDNEQEDQRRAEDKEVRQLDEYPGSPEGYDSCFEVSSTPTTPTPGGNFTLQIGLSGESLVCSWDEMTSVGWVVAVCRKQNSWLKKIKLIWHTKKNEPRELSCDQPEVKLRDVFKGVEEDDHIITCLYMGS